MEAGREGVGPAGAWRSREPLVGQRTEQDLPAGQRNDGSFQGATPVPVRHEPPRRRLVTWIAHQPSMHAFTAKTQATLAGTKALTV
jgi:hypothetical protein